MKPVLFILDIDGTITKDASSYQNVFLESCIDLNIYPKNTNWASYKHHTDRYIFKYNLEKELNRNLNSQDIINFENRLIENLDLSEVQEMPGAIDFIKYLKENNTPYVYATGSMKKAAILKLKHLGINDDDLIIGSNDHDSREDLVSAAIDLAKVHFNIDSFIKTISIGDGLWDLKTAKNLNLDFVGIGIKNKELFDKEDFGSWIKDFVGYTPSLESNY